MEINKRTILWIVFAVSLVVLWNDWMVANGKQSMFSPAPPAKVAQAPAGPPKVTDLPAAGCAAGAVPGAPPGRAAAAPAPSRRSHHRHDRRREADIDTAGGVIRRLELLKYRDKVDKTKNQVLFHTDRATTPLPGQTGLIGRPPPASCRTTTRRSWRVRVVRTLDGNNAVQLVLDAEQGGVR
jgi:YidC/Oxa1 family membrane protein insertase